MSTGDDLAAFAFDLEQLETRRLLAITVSVDASRVMNIICTTGNDTVAVNGLSNGKVSVNGGTQFSPGSGAGQFNKIFINAGNGNDSISINNNFTYLSSTISGSGGRDTITGGKGNDSIDGDNDNDTLAGGGGGADLLRGDGGFDTANYSTRTDSLRISLDGTANDGVSGEGDNVQCEEVLAGSGNDTLTGSSADDFFSGGAGADQIDGKGGNDDITGSTGQDILLGNTGDDFIQAQNQDADQVSGGPNSDAAVDFASVDSIDIPAVQTALSTASLASSSLASSLTARESFAAFATSALVNPTDLDATYGIGGKQTGLNRSLNDLSAAIDSQGRAVFAGWKSTSAGDQIFVTRYTADGAYDTSFGDLGLKVLDFSVQGMTNDRAFGICVAPDDRIIVVGSTTAGNGNDNIAVARLLSTGQPDASFGSGGLKTIDLVGSGNSFDFAEDVVVDSAGRVVIVADRKINGGDQIAVVRLTAAGALDISFNGKGWNTFDPGTGDHVTSVALQGDPGTPRIVVGGKSGGQYMVARFTAGGALDTSFASGAGFTRNGTDSSNQINDLAVASDGRIVAAGFSSGASGKTGTQLSYGVDGQFNGAFITTPNANAEYDGVFVDSKDRVLGVGVANGDYVITRYSFATGLDIEPFLTGFDPVDGPASLDQALACRVISNRFVLAGHSSLDGGLTVSPSALRYLGDQPTQIPDIEARVTDEDLKNPPPGLKERLDILSTSALLLVQSAPQASGSATIDLGAENDLVTLSQTVAADGSTTVTVNVNGVLFFYDPSTTQLLTINTGAGNDTVTSDGTVGIDLNVDLGDGNDTMKCGAEASVVLGGPGSDVLTGGSTSSVLLGGAGEDKLSSTSGYDILIGGTQRDAIKGGSGQDILIGGTTSYDAHYVALRTLLQTWRLRATPFATRVATLQAGVGEGGSIFLRTGAGGTVFSDINRDAISGGSDQDWIIR